MELLSTESNHEIQDLNRLLTRLIPRVAIPTPDIGMQLGKSESNSEVSQRGELVRKQEFTPAVTVSEVGEGASKSKNSTQQTEPGSSKELILTCLLVGEEPHSVKFVETTMMLLSFDQHYKEGQTH